MAELRHIPSLVLSYRDVEGGEGGRYDLKLWVDTDDDLILQQHGMTLAIRAAHIPMFVDALQTLARLRSENAKPR